MAGALDKNYEKAGYHARQSWGHRPALVLIDFAKAYFDPDAPLFGGQGCQTALENSAVLADAARAAGVPVVFTEVKYQPGGSDGGAFYAKVPALSCFDAGTETQELAPPLEMKEGDILITKQYPSGFFGTSLASTLHFMKVDTVLLCGVTTSGCVRATCIDSISHGFVTLVVEDGVGDRAEEPHRANLFDMSAKYADLLNTQDAIAYFKNLKT
ncbi:Hydrolase, isochorismatase family protein [Sulfitobacter noctilucicola]|uniref:Maleamate amidohydrolase n=1 Tax=Sulfitobacter noctilucicola TaxID=1342301 RepID=A0A7W6MAE6_9RHOB|nr:isochorismatase family protein [Sulfitobacter noctilucicola]KIN64082.1 Hydrolase, isochorismatase family protein [Sulfitobacter noctilucicola]MBB4175436.1 maleamate amidohydrolase [Sulfitobacter noctilucicola]